MGEHMHGNMMNMIDHGHGPSMSEISPGRPGGPGGQGGGPHYGENSQRRERQKFLRRYEVIDINI
jgi:hypothetical protein